MWAGGGRGCVWGGGSGERGDWVSPRGSGEEGGGAEVGWPGIEPRPSCSTEMTIDACYERYRY